MKSLLKIGALSAAFLFIYTFSDSVVLSLRKDSINGYYQEIKHSVSFDTFKSNVDKFVELLNQDISNLKDPTYDPEYVEYRKKYIDLCLSLKRDIESKEAGVSFIDQQKSLVNYTDILIRAEDPITVLSIGRWKRNMNAFILIISFIIGLVCGCKLDSMSTSAYVD